MLIFAFGLCHIMACFLYWAGSPTWETPLPVRGRDSSFPCRTEEMIMPVQSTNISSLWLRTPLLQHRCGAETVPFLALLLPFRPKTDAFVLQQCLSSQRATFACGAAAACPERHAGLLRLRVRADLVRSPAICHGSRHSVLSHLVPLPTNSSIADLLGHAVG